MQRPPSPPKPSAQSQALPMKSNLLTCPITQEYFHQPVTTSCGHTFENNALRSHFQSRGNKTCPCCNKPVQFSSEVVVVIKALVVEHLKDHPELAAEYYLDKTILPEMLAKEIEPDFIDAAILGHPDLINLAINCYLERMQKNLAVKAYAKVAKDAKSIECIKPNAKAHYLYGLAHLANKKKAEAKTEFEKVLALEPKNQEAMVQLALLEVKTTPLETMKQRAETIALSGPGSGSADFHYLLARLQFKLGMIQEALQSCQTAFRLDTHHLSARFLFARGLQKQNNLAGAIQIYSAILDENKNEKAIFTKLGQLHYYLGKAYFDQGNKEQAETHFNKALHLQPKNRLQYKLLKQLGMLNYSAKTYQEATQWFLKAIQIKPSSVVYNYLGLCHSHLKDHQSAVDALQKAISLAGKLSAAHLPLARLTVAESHYAMSNWEKAESAATELLAHHPKLQKGFYIRYNARRKLHNFAGARSDAEQAVHFISPSERANLEIELKNYGAAKDILNQAIAVNPSDAELFLKRAEVKSYLSDDSAIKDCQQANQLKPALKEEYRFHITCAKIFQKFGIRNEAMSHCNAAIALTKQNKDPADRIMALSLRYLIHLNGNQIEEAKLDCDEILQINPSSAEYLFKRVLMLIRIGNVAKARQDLKNAAKKGDHFPLANLHLAFIYYLNGNYSEALQALDTAKINDNRVELLRVQSLIGLKRLEDALAILHTLPKHDAALIDVDLFYLQIYTLQEKEVDNLKQYPENSQRRHFLTAMRHVFLNDTHGAKPHFEAALSHDHAPINYYLAYLRNCILESKAEKIEQLLPRLLLNDHLTELELLELHTLIKRWDDVKKKRQAEIEIEIAQFATFEKAFKLGYDVLMRATNTITFGKDLSTAIQHFSQALETGENEAVYYLRGLAYRLSGHFTNALEDIKKALAFNPTSLEIKRELALTLTYRGDYVAAERIMAEISIKDEVFHFYLAQIHFLRAKYDLALQEINEAIAVKSNPAMKLLRVHIHLKLKLMESAYQEYSSINENDIPSAFTGNKISIINQLTQYHKAHQMYLRAQTLPPAEALATIMIAASLCPQHSAALLFKCELLRFTANGTELANTLQQLSELPLTDDEKSKLEKYKQCLALPSTVSIFQAASAKGDLNNSPQKLPKI